MSAAFVFEMEEELEVRWLERGLHKKKQEAFEP